MASVIDQAIVIRRWDFSETSQTVSLLTRHHGIIRGLAKGAKRDKSDFAGGLEVLTEGEVVAIVKPTRELSTLTAWDPRRMHTVLRQDLPANRAAQYMVDLVQHLVIDHDPHPRVFDALSQALATLDQDAGHVESALLALQWAVLCEAGYQPELCRDAETGAALDEGATTLNFAAAAGGVVNDREAPPPQQQRWRVRRDTIDLLRDVAAGVDVCGRTPEQLRRANRLLASYAREIIGAEPSTMRWAFPDLAAPRGG